MASNNYLNAKELYIEILVSKAQGKLTRRAESMLNLLGERIIRKFYYANPDDGLDCYQNGMYMIYKNWYQFDENKTTNAFAYYTEIFKRGIAAGYNKITKNKDRTMSLDGIYADGTSGWENLI